MNEKIAELEAEVARLNDALSDALARRGCGSTLSPVAPRKRVIRLGLRRYWCFLLGTLHPCRSIPCSCEKLRTLRISRKWLHKDVKVDRLSNVTAAISKEHLRAETWRKWGCRTLIMALVSSVKEGWQRMGEVQV